MKKVALILSFFILLNIPLNVNAASSKSIGIIPNLDFDGTTAQCVVSITANSMNEEIDIVVNLLQGSSCLATWNGNGNGYLYFSESTTVTKGKEYKLTVDATIDGKKYDTVSVKGVCR